MGCGTRGAASSLAGLLTTAPYQACTAGDAGGPAGRAGGHPPCASPHLQHERAPVVSIPRRVAAHRRHLRGRGSQGEQRSMRPAPMQPAQPCLQRSALGRRRHAPVSPPTPYSKQQRCTHPDVVALPLQLRVGGDLQELFENDGSLCVERGGQGRREEMPIGCSRPVPCSTNPRGFRQLLLMQAAPQCRQPLRRARTCGSSACSQG